MLNNKNSNSRNSFKILIGLIMLLLGGTIFAIANRRSKITLNDDACDLDTTAGLDPDCNPSINTRRTLRAAAAAPTIQKPPTNILWITFDDARNSMPPYVKQNHPMYPTNINPKLNNFLKSATAFHARTAFPVCSPSRDATTTGKRPENIKAFTFETPARATCPGVLTVSEYFTKKNYKTQTIGKFYHTESELNDASGKLYQQTEYDMGQTNMPHIATTVGNSECNNAGKGYSMYCKVNNAPADNSVVSSAIKFIADRAKETAQPWAIFAGLHHPHWQNNVLARDLQGLIDYVEQPYFPQIPNAADALHSFAFRADLDSMQMKVRFGNKWAKIIKQIRNQPDQLFTNHSFRSTVIEMLKYYLASIRHGLNDAFTIVDALDRYGFRNNTFVVISSDHGLTFGEWMAIMGKNNLGPQATNVPLFIRAPEQTVGLVNEGLASNLDIFSTLVDATFPEDLTGLKLDGKSLLKGVYDAKYNANPNGVITQYPSCQEVGTTRVDDCMTHVGANSCNRAKIKYMGFTLETLEYKLTDWWHFNDDRTECGPLQWPGMPESMRLLSLKWPKWQRFNLQTTGTDWSRPPVKQTELYAMANHIRASDNLATDPQNQNKVAAMTAAIANAHKSLKNNCKYAV